MKNFILGGVLGYFIGGYLCTSVLIEILKKGGQNVRIM